MRKYPRIGMTALAIALFLQACTTITFVRDPKSTRTNYSEWHHNWIFGLMEGSDPVDMHDRCNGAEWKTITTEHTFIQALVNGITYQLYNPHNVEFACAKTAGGDASPEKAQTLSKPSAPAKTRK
ncbi:hypothetical protein EB061_06690 [bacterium]|jgi:hypothetical protein|nr:hypothetical protein [bacterium]